MHVDCESGEINNRLTNCIAVNEDLKYFLQELNSLLPNESISSFSEWKQELQELKAQWPDINELANCNGINPNSFVHALSTKVFD